MTAQEDLLDICRLLSIDETQGCNQTQLLRAILSKLNSKSRELEPLEESKLPDPLAFPADLGESVRNCDVFWDELGKYNDVLKQEFSRRREILLCRLDCTVESFKWKATEQHGVVDTNTKIHDKYEEARHKGLKEMPDSMLSRLLAARSTDCDKLLNCVVSSTTGVDCLIKGNTKSVESLKKVMIPNVPDRGGRVDEIRRRNLF